MADELTDLEVIRVNPIAWAALLTWQALAPGLYQAHVDGYEAWERVAPAGVSIAKAVEDLHRLHPELVHPRRLEL